MYFITFICIRNKKQEPGDSMCYLIVPFSELFKKMVYKHVK